MTDFILWYFYLAVSSWLVLGGLFFAYPTVVRLHNEGTLREFGWVGKVPLIFILILGVISDWVFNILVGTPVFHELPNHELRWVRVWKFKIPYLKLELFTDRLKKHHYGKSEKQKKRAARWVWMVNQIDPGHV